MCGLCDTLAGGLGNENLQDEDEIDILNGAVTEAVTDDVPGLLCAVSSIVAAAVVGEVAVAWASVGPQADGDLLAETNSPHGAATVVGDWSKTGDTDMVAGTVGVDIENAGIDVEGEGTDIAGVGIDVKVLSVVGAEVGVDEMGVDTERVGVDTEGVGTDVEGAGVDIEGVGVYTEDVDVDVDWVVEDTTVEVGDT